MIGRVAAFFYKWMHRRTVKIVHTFHGHSFHGYFSKSKSKLFLTIERVLAKLITDAIITISEKQQEEILGKYKVGKKSQHHMISLGVDLSFADNLDRHSFRKDYNIPETAKLFGIIGRMAPIKNHHLFIESIAYFNGQYDYEDVYFVIVGDGDASDVAELKKLADDKKLNNLVFSGNQDEPTYFYGALDYLALTSKNEGTPVSILESFACKIPIVATAVGGVPDLIGENVRGILAEQKSSDLAEKYDYVLKNDMAEQKENAVTFVQKNYSVDNLSNNIESLYLYLLGQTK
jgi:glycosyltransferase involved in cell wall biosynthesis